MKRYLPWGRQFRFRHRVINFEPGTDLSFMAAESVPMLPFGYGHTYGDSCQNADGILLDTAALDRITSFDQQTGIVRCEAGVQLGKILEHVVPAGWFLPVVPSSGNISLGGAIAHDAHGRNHFREGTIGRHLVRFELLRSDGSRRICSPTENVDYFAATIGGLGLTGLILWAEIALKRIASPYVLTDSTSFTSATQFLELRAASLKRNQYHTAWVDGLGAAGSGIRGVFVSGDLEATSSSTPAAAEAATAKAPVRVPFDMPNWLVNPYTARLFNRLYFSLKKGKAKTQRVHYRPFFYQLDSLGDWNRLLGKRGFLQYHFVLPEKHAAAISEIFNEVQKSTVTPFFVILHSYGPAVSPGFMSFPLEGLGGTLDCLNDGKTTIDLFRRLDTILIRLGGRVYPAKDSAMTPATYQHYFPRWQELAQYRDPKFSSTFWRRVTGSDRLS